MARTGVLADIHGNREALLAALAALRSLAHFPMVYDLFSWSDPKPFVRHWTAKLRSAFTRRMHRWLATAS